MPDYMKHRSFLASRRQYLPFTQFDYNVYLNLKTEDLSCHYFPKDTHGFSRSLSAIQFPKDFAFENIESESYDYGHLSYKFRWIFMNPISGETSSILSESKRTWPEWELGICKMLAVKEWMYLTHIKDVERKRPQATDVLVLKLLAYGAYKALPSADKIEKYFWMNSVRDKLVTCSYAFLFDDYPTNFMPNHFSRHLMPLHVYSDTRKTEQTAAKATHKSHLEGDNVVIEESKVGIKSLQDHVNEECKTNKRIKDILKVPTLSNTLAEFMTNTDNKSGKTTRAATKRQKNGKKGVTK